jgi:hypothetical protein
MSADGWEAALRASTDPNDAQTVPAEVGSRPLPMVIPGARVRKAVDPSARPLPLGVTDFGHSGERATRVGEGITSERCMPERGSTAGPGGGGKRVDNEPGVCDDTQWVAGAGTLYDPVPAG